MAQPPIGPYPHPPPDVKLRPWNPVAPVAADRVIALIEVWLPDTAIEHVGSSAVPGCDGKGSLDFAIPYRDAEHLRAINEALFALGFQRQRSAIHFRKRGRCAPAHSIMAAKRSSCTCTSSRQEAPS